MSKPSKAVVRLCLVIILTFQFYGILFLFPKELESANLTNVSDSLSNNRLSFRGQLNGAVAAGSGLIILRTTGLDSQYTSSGSASLMGNENVKVGNNAPIAVKNIDTDTRVTLASGLTTAAADGDPVIATVSAVHTVTFTPVSAVPNGAFRVLIPQGTTGANDGLPDKDGFDFNSVSSVSCSGGGSGYTFETGTATASAITVGSTTYHSFECRYRGNGGTGTPIVMTIGSPSGNKLINPSPSSTSRYPGQADTYTFRVRHTYGPTYSYSTLDETIGTIGVVEAVRVTATVAPTLTFQISGRASGTTNCGQTAAASTTYNSAPFGTISTSSFTDIAQMLTVSTNAAGGYVVTASESGLLTAYNVTGTPTIANTTCDSGTCTSTSPYEWNIVTNRGFGYSLQDVNGSCVDDTLEWNYSSRTFNARPFDTVGQTIMSKTSPVDSDQAYVCYRIVVSGTQAAGDYENYIIYIATATF